MVHLFDEPQFNTQDGYIGFMLDFFRRLRSEGRLVFVCLHPNERFHLQILQEICERFIFVGAARSRRSPISAASSLMPTFVPTWVHWHRKLEEGWSIVVIMRGEPLLKRLAQGFQRDI